LKVFERLFQGVPVTFGSGRLGQCDLVASGAGDGFPSGDSGRFGFRFALGTRR
jgi:hypothetical protein